MPGPCASCTRSSKLQNHALYERRQEQHRENLRNLQKDVAKHVPPTPKGLSVGARASTSSAVNPKLDPEP